MFARTKRLTLRPGWPEDAPALARAIGHESVIAKLARAPWPYTLDDAEAFLAQPRGATQLRVSNARQEDLCSRSLDGVLWPRRVGQPHQPGDVRSKVV